LNADLFRISDHVHLKGKWGKTPGVNAETFLAPAGGEDRGEGAARRRGARLIFS